MTERKKTGNQSGGDQDAARVRRIRAQSPIYLATAAFLVLGAFVFCVGCQYESRGAEETTQVNG